MAANYWLKLYYEMLDDPKVARLPDSSYRRFIECLLLAGETDSGGFLPTIEDMAWRLRVSETALSQDMSRLAMAGIVELKEHEEGERWFVTKFADRQAAVSGAERVKRHRERNKKREYNATNNDTVTNRYTDIDIDIDIDTDIDVAPPGAKHIHQKEQIPQVVSEFITAIALVSKTPYWPKTEVDYIEAAYYLIGLDASKDDLQKFLSWWNKNGFYVGKPALKTILDEWASYVNGISRKAEPAPNGKIKHDLVPQVKGEF